MNKKNFIYFIGCFLLAIIAEVTLFTETIGISLSIFVVVFYVFYFYLTRKQTHTHRLIGIYIFVCIWLLTLSFVFIGNPYFYPLNLLVVFILIGFHTVLITSPAFLHWSNIDAFLYIQKKVSSFFKLGKYLTFLVRKSVKRRANERDYVAMKRILLGIVIVMPILIILIFLLSMSDQHFSTMVETIITWLVSFKVDEISTLIRIGFIFVFLLLLMKTISKKSIIIPKERKVKQGRWEQATLLTILLSINGLYIFYTVIQFQYFFNDVLINGFTYATYARRGFFELIIVTVINISIILLVNRFAKNRTLFLKIVLSSLIVFSFIILLSAHLRLSLYEQAYGYTYLRLFSHSFIIFLAVFFSFTLIKIWVEKLQLIRFFLLLSLLYYCGLNVMDIDRLIVSKNLQRFDETNLIDFSYIDALSYSTIPVLVDYYESNPEMKSVKHLLLAKKELLQQKKQKWQSYNIVEDRARKLLGKIDFDKKISENQNVKNNN
ncbi:DUF4173 domain-containing protein [Cytobacillus oceanisediminis]|uniref:DUF4173 domain-containing protein n=1 Tax=Niallia alba TaxID=2729105 RepID=A0A7Y0K8V3_9BACI|nr:MULTISPECIES: DUF4173 domain-containing protein [Bacillaceae]MBQ6446829.1 DUF4173 domain-containing protein [Bacillus sp. (in: firmicutes)]MBZ9536682.1 DUF4173 domain-containing protein [Cytobacillus oceanisediminis]NMO77984.1 DUF4173 domain-containing protein [Niallia alba]